MTGRDVRAHVHRCIIRMRAPLIDGLGHAKVVFDSASFLFSNTVVLSKLPFYFSST